MTEPIARQIVSLAEQGMSPKAIAHAAGCEIRYVYLALQRAGYAKVCQWVRVVPSGNMKPPEDQR